MKKYKIAILAILGCIGLLGFSTAVNIGIKEMFDHSGRVKQIKLSTGQTYPAATLATVFDGGGGGSGDASYPINLAGGTATTGILPLTQGGWGTSTPNTLVVKQTNGTSTEMAANNIAITGTNSTGTFLTLTVTGTATTTNLTTTNLTVTQSASLPAQESTTGSASVSVGPGQSYTINSTGSSTNTIVLNCSGIISATNTGSMDLSGLQGGVNLGSATLNYSNLMDSARTRPFIFQDFDTITVNQTPPFNMTAILSGIFGGPGSLDLTNHPGVGGIVGSSSVGSGYMLRTTANDRILTKGSFFDSMFMVDVNSTLRIGFFDTSTSAEPTDSACLFLPGTLTVYGNTSAGGTKGTTTSNYTLTIDTWYRGTGELGSSSTSFSFAIYNEDSTQLLWTDSLTTNLPTASGQNFGCGIISTAIDTTAQNQTYIDYIAFGNKQPLAR